MLQYNVTITVGGVKTHADGAPIGKPEPGFRTDWKHDELKGERIPGSSAAKPGG